jgi:hypothetical protein
MASTKIWRINEALGAIAQNKVRKEEYQRVTSESFLSILPSERKLEIARHRRENSQALVCYLET